MSENFENISIVKKANVYFGGQVTSRTVVFADGSKKTLGFMQAGDYEFGTEAAELMEMLGGEMDVKLDGSMSGSPMLQVPRLTSRVTRSLP